MSRKKKALTRHSMMKQQVHDIAENVLKDNKSAVADL